MLEWLESIFTALLGDASVLGAKSWLEALTWLAGVGAVICAALSLRRQALQSRATLFLTLYDRWESLATQRWAFEQFYQPIRDKVLNEHAIVQECHKRDALREAFAKEVRQLVESDDQLVRHFVDYLNFFETLGHYVRRRYIPFKIVRSLYKGPILEIDFVFRLAVKDWERHAHVPSGLFGNAVSLMKEMRYREDHPIKYRVVRLFKRSVG